MKIIVQLLSMLFLPTLLLGQGHSSKSSLAMTWEQNQQWLITLKEQKKSVQWKMITDRYFQSNTNATDETSRLYTPALIINGLPILISDSTSVEDKSKLLSLPTEDKIDEIIVVEKLPESLNINRPFTGIILARLSDKKTSKALKKIKVH